MGRRSKRKKRLLRKQRLLGIELDPQEARRVGLGHIIDEQERIKAEAEAQRLEEEKRLAEEAAKAEAAAKKKAEGEAKKKKEAEAKKKAAPKKRAIRKKAEAKDKE